MTKNQWVAPESGLEGFTVSRRSRSEVKSKGPFLFFLFGGLRKVYLILLFVWKTMFFWSSEEFFCCFLLFNLKQYCPTLICLVRVFFWVESCSLFSTFLGCIFVAQIEFLAQHINQTSPWLHWSNLTCCEIRCLLKAQACLLPFYFQPHAPSPFFFWIPHIPHFGHKHICQTFILEGHPFDSSF